MKDKRLETVDDSNWEDFTSSPFAVLVVTNADCALCKNWRRRLSEFLERDEEFTSVRFGVVKLETENVSGFEKANKEWLDIVEGVPFNALYAKGEPRTSFYGDGVDRMKNRLAKLIKDMSE